MKSMEEYINEVYEKYEETERNHQKYKTVKVKYHSPLTKLCVVVACIALIITVGMGTKYIKTENREEIKYVTGERQEDNSVVYKQYLRVDTNFDDNLVRLVNSSDYLIVTTKIEKIGCNYESVKGKFFIETIGNIEISKVLKGKISANIIKYSQKTGKVSLKELQTNEHENWEKWELDNIGKIIPESEKANTYFEQIPQKGTIFEEGKQYLVFMNYNEEEDLYEINDIAYGIMEYDPETQMVKNIDTGEFVEIDWSLIK